MQVTAQRGRRLVPGAVRRHTHAQPHRAGQAEVEGRQLRAGLRARIEEAGSRGRGGAHDAAAVHAQRIVRNNFGGRVGTRGIIAGIHFVRTEYGSHFLYGAESSALILLFRLLAKIICQLYLFFLLKIIIYF